VSTIITLAQQQDKKTIGDGNCAFHSALRDKYESTIRGLLGKIVREVLDTSDRLFLKKQGSTGNQFLTLSKQNIKKSLQGMQPLITY